MQGVPAKVQFVEALRHKLQQRRLHAQNAPNESFNTKQ